MMKRLALHATVVVSILSVSVAVHAQEEETPEVTEAIRLYKIGDLHFKGGEFDRAAEAFSKAYGLDPNPLLGFNAGRAFENAGHPDKALDWYKKVKASGTDDQELTSRIDAAIVRVQHGKDALDRAREAEAKRPGKLEFSSSMKATLELDGAMRGQLPLVAEVGPGKHKVVVRANESSDVITQEVEVDPGGVHKVHAVLHEDPPIFTWVGWTGVGVTTVGGLFLLQGMGQAITAQNEYELAQDETEVRNRNFEEHRAAGEDAQDASRGAYIAGSIFTALGVGLIIWDRSFLVPGMEEGELQLSFAPQGMVLSGEF